MNASIIQAGRPADSVPPSVPPPPVPADPACFLVKDYSRPASGMTGDPAPSIFALGVPAIFEFIALATSEQRRIEVFTIGSCVYRTPSD